MEYNTENTKQAVRIQTSIFNAIEKKILVSMAKKMPAWVTPDLLTFIGFIGAAVIATGFALTNVNINWIWLGIFGFFLNWFGDSMDGSLARVRNTQRKTYGFYIDHNVDCINEIIMFVGIGSSVLMHLTFAMAVLVNYFLLSVFVYINCHLKGEMRLTYGGLGPTELRILVSIASLICIYVPAIRDVRFPIDLFHNHFDMTVFDIFSVVVGVLILVAYTVSFFKEAAYFAKLDPLKNPEENGDNKA